MAEWGENKTVGVVAAVVAVIAFSLVFMNLARSAARFKKAPAQSVVPAGPAPVR